TTDRAVVASDRLLVALRLPAAIGSVRAPGDRPPADRARVTVHLGTVHVGAVVGRTGRDAGELPGGEFTAILRLDRAIGVAPGDRFALRRPSPGLVVAGGRVLDPEPSRGVARRRTTVARLARLASSRPANA